METVIKLTPDSHGIYRYVRNVDVSLYPETDWLHNPDLTAVGAVPQKYWKVSGSPLSVLEMSAGEKAAIDDDEKEHLNTSVAGTLAFEKSGICKNRWIGFGASKSSNSIPYINPFPMTITALTFTNLKSGADTDIELYKNGIKIHTWEVRDKRWCWLTQGLHSLSFDSGDKISIYLRDKGTDPKHVIVTLHYNFWMHKVGEGGSSVL